MAIQIKEPKNAIKIIKQKAPKCENCNKSTEDPKRFAFVFASQIHPGILFDPEIELPIDFYKEYEEEKTFIMIKCPTIRCQTTFECN